MTDQSKDLFTLINERMHSLSKGHKLIANYILSHYDKAAFMTAQQLGRTVGVSESTTVRFAAERPAGKTRNNCNNIPSLPLFFNRSSFD